ncbi:MAG: hypothetical protein J2O49_07055, partial [Sciscionella sp.]|nr:hypothetical protein [Sciscionella sp.]
AWWPDVGMAWEVDSFAERITAQRYARTIAKHARLIACGVVVLHSTPSRLRHDRPTLADELRRSYACASQRPTPEVLPHS